MDLSTVHRSSVEQEHHTADAQMAGNQSTKQQPEPAIRSRQQVHRSRITQEA
ncbi:hypothetical protein OsI_16786 [Oryza sativa Indica Group]|uniref:OSJNBa0091D06.1 protein n=3 Tax=Oryza TaxID=4527 RepID=Q7XU08_ORYSJ|nr:hypothetical protein OsI_16786 [Oryza sativa Indica Group]EAZ31464.1 hypothetical protein OsJ_15601 [Oryza sativa Japonica Group]CAD41635.3 OSJNBa0091D06.1 [Oryza sativa Japonica Group]